MGVCDQCHRVIDIPYHIDEDVICESCYFELLDDSDDEDEDKDDED